MGAAVLGVLKHTFRPQGVTVILMLAESHMAIHTYPEYNRFFLDIFTCGDLDASEAISYIAGRLGCTIMVNSTLRPAPVE